MVRSFCSCGTRGERASGTGVGVTTRTSGRSILELRRRLGWQGAFASFGSVAVFSRSNFYGCGCSLTLTYVVHLSSLGFLRSCLCWSIAKAGELEHPCKASVGTRHFVGLGNSYTAVWAMTLAMFQNFSATPFYKYSAAGCPWFKSAAGPRGQPLIRECAGMGHGFWQVAEGCQSRHVVPYHCTASSGCVLDHRASVHHLSNKYGSVNGSRQPEWGHLAEADFFHNPAEVRSAKNRSELLPYVRAGRCPFFAPDRALSNDWVGRYPHTQQVYKHK